MAALNEGRSLNSGDTPPHLTGLPSSRPLNEGRSLNSGDTPGDPENTHSR